MTQLYVGNLSEHGDEKNIRLVFGKYGSVREVLMKNGYAFVEMETALQAEHVMRELNGTDILGNPMIVEPSHQQRLSNRPRRPVGIVEVTNIPTNMTLEAIENYFNQTIGQVVKIEIEDNQPADFGAKRILVSFDSPEQAHRAAALYGNEQSHLRCTVVEEPTRPGSAGSMKNGRRSSSIPNSPSKGSNEFPLRILVPADMVGAIIGKDGATIRNITQLTKARVDVHRRENLGSMEKAITIIGSPESCTEACYQIMQIMQNELLMTSNSGSIFDHNKHHFDPQAKPFFESSLAPPMKSHFEPLPVVPLKILAHNELVGRVIGKAGNTLKRIMAESGTKITISKLKDLTAYNMERTITILGTIDNCKKAESLISAKLRASYESDMTQFMNCTGPSDNSPTHSNSPPHSMNGEVNMIKPAVIHPHSLPATPTAVRTFQDFSSEHTRLLTTLHGSTGTLEVNGLGGFYSSVKNGTSNGSSHSLGVTLGGGAGSMDPVINGYNKYDHPEFIHHGNPHHHYHGNRGGSLDEEDLTDVLQGLTLSNKEHHGNFGGFSRQTMMGPNIRRSSVPAQSGPTMGWPESIIEEPPVFSPNPSISQQQPPPPLQSKFMSGFNTFNPLWQPPCGTQSTHIPQQQQQQQQQQQPPPPPPSQQQSNGPVGGGGGGSIWSPTFSSRPESELSSYQDSEGSANGFSPIYSPVSAVTSGFFEPFVSTVVSSSQQFAVQTSQTAKEFVPKSSASPSASDQMTGPVDLQTSVNKGYSQPEGSQHYLDKLINEPTPPATATPISAPPNNNDPPVW